MNHDLPQIPTPHCPHCYSRNLVPLSKKTLIGAGVGASIGGLISLFGLYQDEQPLAKQDIPLLLTGMMTGAIAGVALANEKPNGSIVRHYVCLSCYNRFTWIPGALN